MVCNGSEALLTIEKQLITLYTDVFAKFCYSVRGARKLKVFLNNMLVAEKVYKCC